MTLFPLRPKPERDTVMKRALTIVREKQVANLANHVDVNKHDKNDRAAHFHDYYLYNRQVLQQVSRDQLGRLVAPIALYPDALVAQISRQRSPYLSPRARSPAARLPASNKFTSHQLSVSNLALPALRSQHEHRT